MSQLNINCLMLAKGTIFFLLSFIFIQLSQFLSFFSAALNVELEDASFPLTDFEVVAGSLKAKWSRIGAYPFVLS